ncbi:MAG: TlpA family protein disulfide reductase [Bacteroidales bacterium]|jgi:thiol-disulfide isomerase/thioredoxin|nr:TlpA family protein disulfide reductase [Bacteroidales bacterium]
MTHKYFLTFIFFLLSGVVFSQQLKYNPDGSISISASFFLHYDSNGVELTNKQFSDSLATGGFFFSTEFRNDTVKYYLKNKKPDIVGKLLPMTTFTDINGKNMHIGEAKTTILNFWNTTCSPCIKELNELNKLAETFKDVAFIAITKDSLQKVKKFMDGLNVDWNSLSIVTGYKGEFDHIFEITVYPLNLIVDNKCIIRNVSIGKSLVGIREYIKEPDIFK